MSPHTDGSAANEELTELRRQLTEKVQLLEFGRQIGPDRSGLRRRG